MNTLPRAAGPAPRSTAAAPERERVLGRFRLIAPLGSGGHGTVWEARDERLRRTVALKRIPRADEQGGDDHRRIDREALAAARLSHPAIVAFYEALADADAYYLVSELVRGSSLAARYARARPSDRELIAIGCSLAGALAHAHARGVVHRDVKPQNVIIAQDMLETGARAKLTDFGVAQIAGEQPLTRTGDVIGTLAYMSPEQADGKPASTASDLYALALTLYEGFAGGNPLRGATAVATVKRLSEGIAPLAAARPDLPRRLTRAIDRALCVDPSRRGSLGELRDALVSARGPRAANTPRLGPPRQRRDPRERATPLSARAKRLLSAAGTAALSAATLASVLGPRSAGTILATASVALVAGALAPRATWLVLAFGAVAWTALAGQPGTAVVLCVALAPAPVLLAGEPWLWSLPALAPLLGLAELAAAFPALAARAGGTSAWRRASLAALGCWWLAAGELLGGRHLLFGLPPGAAPRASWAGSVGGALIHAVGPLCTPALLAPAALWALAAAVLPWLLRDSSGAGRALRAAGWAAGLLLGTLLLAASGSASVSPLVLVAASLAGLLALSGGRRGARARVA